MRKILTSILLTTLGLASHGLYARDTESHLSIQEALDSVQAKEKLDGSVKFYFGKQAHPKVLETKGSDVSNRKTNAFNKSDEAACQWAFISVLLAFQDKAKSLGANAVIDLQSYYKKEAFVSDTEYECHAGAFIGGVALKGTYAKLAK